MFYECRRKEKCLNHPQRCPSCHACADLMNPYPLFKDKDVVEVVRCKDCVHLCTDRYPGALSCDFWDMESKNGFVEIHENDFCSSGKRRCGSDGPQ